MKKEVLRIGSLEVSRKTKRKPAYIKIEILDEDAEHILREMTIGKGKYKRVELVGTLKDD